MRIFVYVEVGTGSFQVGEVEGCVSDGPSRSVTVSYRHLMSHFQGLVLAVGVDPFGTAVTGSQWDKNTRTPFFPWLACFAIDCHLRQAKEWRMNLRLVSQVK